MLINNLGDIGKVDYKKIPDFDLFNFSFPCQNISVAGKQEGMKSKDGSITNSGLYIYGIKVIEAKRPKYMMIENVKNLIGKKFIKDFYKIINQIGDLGYNCYYPTKEDKKGNKKPTCLNAKDFGIPQNRERIFVIFIRKDVDTYNFKFPIGKDYGIRLKDILEDVVDEKYYLSQDIQNRFKSNGTKDINHNELNLVGSSALNCRTISQRSRTYGVNGIISTLTATDYKQPKQILNINKLSKDGKTICEQRSDEGIRFFKDNICGTIRTIDSGGDKRIIEENKLKQIGKLQLEGYNDFSKRVYDIEGVGRTLMSSGGNSNDKAGQYLVNYKIRRLTPTECWRLMGFRDEHINKAIELGMSDSQLYKQAGNSIVVNVLYFIFKNLFKDYTK